MREKELSANAGPASVMHISSGKDLNLTGDREYGVIMDEKARE